MRVRVQPLLISLAVMFVALMSGCVGDATPLIQGTAVPDGFHLCTPGPSHRDAGIQDNPWTLTSDQRAEMQPVPQAATTKILTKEAGMTCDEALAGAVINWYAYANGDDHDTARAGFVAEGCTDKVRVYEQGNELLIVGSERADDTRAVSGAIRDEDDHWASAC